MTTNTSTDFATITVLGGPGKTGRRVAERLASLGGHRVHVPRRDGSTSTRFDWTDRDTWADAVAGADAVYVAYQPDLVVERALDDIVTLAGDCENAGVRRVVLLSGRGEPEADACGRALHESSLDTTVLRCAWFAQNFTESFLADDIPGGLIVAPDVRVPEPFVDVDDIAAVAVTALTEDGHADRTYDLTGPEAVTLDEVAAIIGSATGHTVTYTPVPLAEYRTAMLDAGAPAEITDVVTTLFGTLFDGRNRAVERDIERVLGRPARSLRDVAEAAVAQGVWR